MLLLSGGDVTKRETILWTVTLKEAEPYLEWQMERRTVDHALYALLIGKRTPAAPTPAAPKFKGIGEACGNQLLPRCQPFYQDKLHVACRTCPGPRKG